MTDKTTITANLRHEEGGSLKKLHRQATEYLSVKQASEFNPAEGSGKPPNPLAGASRIPAIDNQLTVQEDALAHARGLHHPNGDEIARLEAAVKSLRIRSLSTQESEIQSLSEATRYVMFFRYLLEELGIPQCPTIIYEDNNAAISFAKGQGDYDRTKHISRHFRFCADQVRANTIVVERIDTDKQRADQQTKILDPNLHKQHTAVNLNLKNQVQFTEDI